MKKITLLFVASFIALVSFGQNAPHINGEYPSYGYLITTSAIPATASSIVFKSYSNEPAMQYEGEHRVDKCDAFHRMKVAGIVLTAVGGAMILTGSIMRGAAYSSNVDGHMNNPDYNAMENGGAAMIGVGTLSLGTGIPLLIIGCIKTNKYCRGAAY